MSGWFEITQNDGGQFHFVLKVGNVETILTSQMCAAKASAENGIASVQANCGNDTLYERKTASDGRPFFNLKATNGQEIRSSQMYASEASRDSGIASVKENRTSTKVKTQG